MWWAVVKGWKTDGSRKGYDADILWDTPVSERVDVAEPTTPRKGLSG